MIKILVLLLIIPNLFLTILGIYLNTMRLPKQVKRQKTLFKDLKVGDFIWIASYNTLFPRFITKINIKKLPVGNGIEIHYIDYSFSKFSKTIPDCFIDKDSYCDIYSNYKAAKKHLTS